MDIAEVEWLAEVPPSCGHRLLPTVIDQLAWSDPLRIFTAVSATSDVRDGFIDVTYSQIGRAIDRCAWWIKDNLGTSSNFQTITYMGPADLVYAILILSCVKTGYRVSEHSQAM